MTKKPLEEKVALCAINHDPETHIEVDADLCATCGTRICLRACPAGLYTEEPETRQILVDHTGCLECGTCKIICALGAVCWHYPSAGHGIHYRYG